MSLYTTGPWKSNRRANDTTHCIYHQGHGRRGTTGVRAGGRLGARGAGLAWPWVREMLYFHRTDYMLNLKIK